MVKQTVPALLSSTGGLNTASSFADPVHSFVFVKRGNWRGSVGDKPLLPGPAVCELPSPLSTSLCLLKKQLEIVSLCFLQSMAHLDEWM